MADGLRATKSGRNPLGLRPLFSDTGSLESQRPAPRSVGLLAQRAYAASPALPPQLPDTGINSGSEFTIVWLWMSQKKS